MIVDDLEEALEDDNMESDGNNNKDNTGNDCDNNVNTCDDDGITSDSSETLLAVTVFQLFMHQQKASPLEKEKDGTITKINCAKSVNDSRRCMGGVDIADMFKSYYAIDR
ncbi:hypothetical protein NQ314_014478 [Rhamnusium bicolor]|uniref:Uncharacterized protein n=1 Tax=Rhamnusium bicolor TaxID=1586634 RepID=A0AAV8X213_9CUCU|nr:hypothetical protein NQ314_014478 [Rhamnusium bicolor]